MFDLSVLIALLQGLGIMALLTHCFGGVERQTWKSEFKSVLHGTVFGIGTIVAMSTPAQLGQGINVDARYVILGVTAAFCGPLSALIAVTLAAAYRLHLGGIGADAGALSALCAGTIGLIWRIFIKEKKWPQLVRLGLLGIMIPFCLLAALVAPPEIGIDYVRQVTLPLMSASLLGALVFGAFIERETAQIDKELDLRRRALTDGLTGLANRMAFDRRLSAELSCEPGERPALALLLIDADLFKQVNDRFGHIFGDEVLRVLSKIFADYSTQDDMAARLGGEEFGLLLATRSPNRAQRVAERIRAAVEGHQFYCRGVEFSVTVSIGCAVARAGESAASLYNSADQALYKAKQVGRNRVESRNIK